MAKKRNDSPRRTSRGFVVSREYFREQAGHAIANFFAPFAGVYDAAKGREPTLAHHESDDHGQKRLTV